MIKNSTALINKSHRAISKIVNYNDPFNFCSPTMGCGPLKSLPSYSLIKETESKISNLKEETKEICSLDKLDFLWLELTQKCNLKCIHCYTESGPEIPLFQKMQTDDWKQCIKDAYSVGCQKIQFTGGEPTLNPYLQDLIKFSKKLGYFFVEVFTNGTSFNRHLKRTFYEYDVNLAFSIYSYESDIHDSITLSPGSFNKTLENITWALNIGLNVRVSIILTHLIQNKSELTLKFLKSLGISNISIDHERGVGRGLSNSMNVPLKESICRKCLRDKVCISSSGAIYPCIFARSYSFGNAINGLKSILQSNNLRNFRKSLN